MVVFCFCVSDLIFKLSLDIDESIKLGVIVNLDIDLDFYFFGGVVSWGKFVRIGLVVNF